MCHGLLPDETSIGNQTNLFVSVNSCEGKGMFISTVSPHCGYMPCLGPNFFFCFQVHDIIYDLF